MPITNESKPITGVPQTELNIGSGFNLLVGGVYKLVIGALNTTAGMSNTDKASIGETWATWATPWEDETRTWDELSQLFVNTTKATGTITNESKPS